MTITFSDMTAVPERRLSAKPDAARPVTKMLVEDRRRQAFLHRLK